jgi:hypothetical protein
MTSLSRAVAALGLGCFFAVAPAQVIWNETIHGDLSGDRLNPTGLSLGLGPNLLLANTGPGDREYVHFSLGAGMSLVGIHVVSYVSEDPIAFIGVQAGSVFTEPHDNPDPANLLGWAFFGPEQLGQDILPAMGNGWDSIGFTPPLTGSNYTFWIQQTGNPSDYTLNFVVVPEPGTMSLAVGAAALLFRRRRK